MTIKTINFPVECSKLVKFWSYLEDLKFIYPEVSIEYKRNSGIFLEDYLVKLTGSLEDLSRVIEQIKSDERRYKNND